MEGTSCLASLSSWRRANLIPVTQKHWRWRSHHLKDANFKTFLVNIWSTDFWFRSQEFSEITSAFCAVDSTGLCLSCICQRKQNCSGGRTVLLLSSSHHLNVKENPWEQTSHRTHRNLKKEWRSREDKASVQAFCLFVAKSEYEVVFKKVESESTHQT